MQKSCRALARWLGLTALMLGLVVVGPFGAHSMTAAAAYPRLTAHGSRPTPPLTVRRPLTTDSLPSALQATLAAYHERLAPNATFALDVHQDGAWAYAVAQEVDAQRRPVPYRAIVLLAHKEPAGWRVLAPRLAQPGEYNALLQRFPDELLNQGAKAYLTQPELRALANFSGHRLPWPAGEIAYLTQKDGPEHENRLDFDILGLQAAGTVYASKPGTVVYVKQDSNRGSCNWNDWPYANMVVVQHGPAEFSWYVHLAYNSVPVRVGDRVEWGTKIGIEGNTGYACGVHLHYMASTGHSPFTEPNPWATGITAVDFDEVPWAGLVEGRTYVSANRPVSAGLQVVGPLSLDPLHPAVGQPVSATFTVRNVGAELLTLRGLGVAARGPSCTDWACARMVDFPPASGLTLAPNEEATYRQQRPFSEVGGYFAEPAYRDASGTWHLGIPGGQRVTFAVGVVARVYVPVILR